MAHDPSDHPGPPGDLRPLQELVDSGLLWLVNRCVFHPRGLALGLFVEEGEVLGWRLLAADADQPFAFADPQDTDGYRRAETTLHAALAEREE